MDEILGSVSMLAQDQYGNYVVQVRSSDDSLCAPFTFSLVENVQFKPFDFIFWSACSRCQKTKII